VNLTVNTEHLAAEAAWIAKLKPGNGFNEVTHTVQVATLLGAVRLRRTDFEQFRETIVPATGAGQASITVDASRLATQLKKATGPAVVDIADGWLSITLRDKTVKLRDAKAEFVDWPEFLSSDLPATVSARQITRALTSVGHDDTLPVLTGVAFDGGSMITTDRFRLTQVAYADSGFTTLAPGAVLQAFANGDDAITVHVGTSNKTPMVKASTGRRSVVAPVLDAEFPKWRQLIPEEASLSMLLRRDDLLAAAQCDRVTLSMKDKDTMVVSSTDSEGQIEVVQEVTVTTIESPEELPLPVTLNTKYLTESLRAIGSGAIRLKVNAPAKPILIEDIGNTDFHLLMPIRAAG
jgi:DNA polymerase-3 subunit beta